MCVYSILPNALIYLAIQVVSRNSTHGNKDFLFLISSTTGEMMISTQPYVIGANSIN